MDRNYKAKIVYIYSDDLYFIYEVEHKGLHEYRRIRSKDDYECQMKAQALADKWNSRWAKKCDTEEQKKKKKEGIQEAIDRTAAARNEVSQVKKILIKTLNKDNTLDWEKNKHRNKFDEVKPRKPVFEIVPSEPQRDWDAFKPKLNFLDKLIASWRRSKEKDAANLFAEHHECWEKKRAEIEQKNIALNDVYKNKLYEWEERKNEFYKEQENFNEHIKQFESNYRGGEPEAVKRYCNLVLTKSEYPDKFPQNFDLEYNSETKLLAIDYVLPAPEDMPKLKEIKYISSKNEFQESYLSESAQKKLYNKAIYEICLRTVHEIFSADIVNAVSSVSFNGIVNTIDASTGNSISPCILSLHTAKESFLKINLAMVNPKDCFKKLKGVGSSSLCNLASVAPIIPLNKKDKRFIVSYDVIDKVDDSTNIAAMDWQDFEHMIREIFEKEFAPDGGEVKVTQGSRDGGVDAVIFDPDPIRGGKIIIQAKRYTNTVEVSAVRDLYGTVLNEGAMKGILISTADYGPDSYDFAKDKPITLINGSNLLYLLEKHGQKAKIDLKEAKKILVESRNA